MAPNMVGKDVVQRRIDPMTAEATTITCRRVVTASKLYDAQELLNAFDAAATTGATRPRTFPSRTGSGRPLCHGLPHGQHEEPLTQARRWHLSLPKTST